MHLRVAKVIHWLHYFNNIKDVLTHCLRASLRQLTPGLTQPVRGTILAITAMVLITRGVLDTTPSPGALIHTLGDLNRTDFDL